MTATRRLVRVCAVVASSALGVVGCDADDDNAAPRTSASQAVVTDGGVRATSVTIPTVPPEVAITPGPTFATVPVSGVPGLDSSDGFCSAWSRFGGTWQVIIIQSAFADDPAAVARLEVIAAPVVTAAYDDLFAAWPAELESERGLVADAYFGTFQRRSATALDALVANGAGEAELAALEAAWLAALAGYDPATAAVAVDLDPELDAIVTGAATTFAAARTPIGDDPSMVITAETPLTDAFLASACPDQGWIVGQEVGISS